MALDVTVGGASADSYASLAEFTTYVTNRPNAPTWFATATDATKEAALKFAAKLLDGMFAWTGSAVDSVQARSWPRSGMFTRNGYDIATTTNPVDLKNAQCEWALRLGQSDIAADNDALKQGITSVKAGSVAVTFKTVDMTDAEAADVAVILQQSDFFYLSKTVPDAVRFLLVPSWYTEASVKRPLIFGAI